MAIVEYLLLDGNSLVKDRLLSCGTFDELKGEIFRGESFISQRKEEPVGMFRVIEIDRKAMKLTLEEIDCAPIHWKGKDGWAYGPNDECEERCKFYNGCPISAHLMLMSDT